MERERDGRRIGTQGSKRETEGGKGKGGSE